MYVCMYANEPKGLKLINKQTNKPVIIIKYIYVLKMKKHEKHVVNIVHMIIKLDEWLNYVYEFIV